MPSFPIIPIDATPRQAPLPSQAQGIPSSASPFRSAGVESDEQRAARLTRDVQALGHRVGALESQRNALVSRVSALEEEERTFQARQQTLHRHDDILQVQTSNPYARMRGVGYDAATAPPSRGQPLHAPAHVRVQPPDQHLYTAYTPTTIPTVPSLSITYPQHANTGYPFSAPQGTASTQGVGVMQPHRVAPGYATQQQAYSDPHRSSTTQPHSVVAVHGSVPAGSNTSYYHAPGAPPSHQNPQRYYPNA